MIFFVSQADSMTYLISCFFAVKFVYLLIRNEIIVYL